MGEEEVQRVTDALDAVDKIKDPEARVRVKSKLMAEQVRRNKTWSEERRRLILSLGEEGVSYRQIAARLGTTLSVVQDVFRGYSGSGSHRPKAPPLSPPDDGSGA